MLLFTLVCIFRACMFPAFCLHFPLGDEIVQHSCSCILPVYRLMLSGRRWRKFLCMITAVRLRFAVMSESLHQMNLWCRYCSRFYFFNSREWVETNLSRTPERRVAGFRRLRIMCFSRRNSRKCYHWFQRTPASATACYRCV